MQVDKTNVGILSDLLKVTWLNLKNSEEILLHNLKNIQDDSIKESIKILHKDLQDVDKINSDIDGVLKQIDKGIRSINEILITNQAPNDIVSSDQILEKFNWSRKQLERNIVNLKNTIGDFEDKQTSLQHENQQIHSEFRSYVARMQVSADEKDFIAKELENLKRNAEINKEKLSLSEMKQLSMQTLIDNQVTEIEELNKKIVTLEIENNLLEEKNKSQSLTENLHDQDKIDCQSQTNNDGFSLDSEENCRKCSKYLNKINQLLKDLEEVHNRYSAKREKHRQKLIEARTAIISNQQHFIDQNNEQKLTIVDLLEKLRLLQLRFQKAIHEKVQLSKRIVPMENEIVNLSNDSIIYKEKIKKLESHIENLIQKLYDKMVLNETESF